MSFSPQRNAVALLFLLDGFGFGVWAAHVPVLKQAFQLSDGRLSVVLFALVAGSLLSMPLTGQALLRTSSRTMGIIGGIAYCASLLFIGWAGTVGLLVACAALFGASKGSLDVTVNALTVTLEKKASRSFMSLMQACWSIGGLIGAGLSSIALKNGGTLHKNFSAAVVVLVILAAYSFPRLLGEVSASEAGSKWSLPSKQILGLSIIAFFGLFAEGAISDWSAVYLRSVVGLTLSASALGFSVYASAMACARLAGHWILQRVTGAHALIGGGILLIAGFMQLLHSKTEIGSLTGLSLAGFGVANVVPVVMTMAGRDKRMGSGPAISAVSTVGYFGFLAGPPLIGWLAVHLGLGRALLLVVLSGSVVALSPYLGFYPRTNRTLPQ
jgi:MFS family permease